MEDTLLQKVLDELKQMQTRLQTVESENAILKKDIAKWTQLIKTKKISPE